LCLLLEDHDVWRRGRVFEADGLRRTDGHAAQATSAATAGQEGAEGGGTPSVVGGDWGFPGEITRTAVGAGTGDIAAGIEVEFSHAGAIVWLQNWHLAEHVIAGDGRIGEGTQGLRFDHAPFRAAGRHLESEVGAVEVQIGIGAATHGGTAWVGAVEGNGIGTAVAGCVGAILRTDCRIVTINLVEGDVAGAVAAGLENLSVVAGNVAVGIEIEPLTVEDERAIEVRCGVSGLLLFAHFASLQAVAATGLDHEHAAGINDVDGKIRRIAHRWSESHSEAACRSAGRSVRAGEGSALHCGVAFRTVKITSRDASAGGAEAAYDGFRSPTAALAPHAKGEAAATDGTGNKGGRGVMVAIARAMLAGRWGTEIVDFDHAELQSRWSGEVGKGHRKPRRIWSAGGGNRSDGHKAVVVGADTEGAGQSAGHGSGEVTAICVKYAAGEAAAAVGHDADDRRPAWAITVAEALQQTGVGSGKVAIVGAIWPAGNRDGIGDWSGTPAGAVCYRNNQVDGLGSGGRSANLQAAATGAGDSDAIRDGHRWTGAGDCGAVNGPRVRGNTAWSVDPFRVGVANERTS